MYETIHIPSWYSEGDKAFATVYLDETIKMNIEGLKEHVEKMLNHLKTLAKEEILS